MPGGDQLSKLLLLTLEDHFGPVCSRTAEVVLGLERATLGQIVSSGNLSLKQTRTALAVMIKHHLISYRLEGGKTWYSLNSDNILAVRQFPQLLEVARTSHGEAATSILEEIIRAGSLSLSLLLHGLGCSLQSEDRAKLHQTISDYKKTFLSLLSDGFIKPLDAEKQDIDVKDVVEAVLSEDGGHRMGADRVRYLICLGKMTEVLRNQMIVAAAVRRLYDEAAGQVVSSLLELGGPAVSHGDIVRQVARQHGGESQAARYLDQYLNILTDDRTRFLLKVGDDGGGKYQVNIDKILVSVTETVLDNVIMEKFCSKTARVFRYIRSKKYVEEGALQGAVMIPSKETKEITYKLLENHFIHLQELRKTISSTAPTKSVYLYYVDLYQVVRSVLQSCYKATSNLISRGRHENETNARLLEKHERAESLLESLRAGGASEEQISEEMAELMTPPEQETLQEVQRRLHQINRAIKEVSDNIFLLRLVLNIKTKS